METEQKRLQQHIKALERDIATGKKEVEVHFVLHAFLMFL
jgi:hypothetical protein